MFTAVLHGGQIDSPRARSVSLFANFQALRLSRSLGLIRLRAVLALRFRGRFPLDVVFDTRVAGNLSRPSGVGHYWAGVCPIFPAVSRRLLLRTSSSVEGR